MGEMCMIGTPETGDKESGMNAYSTVYSASCSLAKECKHLYDDEERVNDVMGHRNRKKIENKHKFKFFLTYKIRMMLRWWK